MGAGVCLAQGMEAWQDVDDVANGAEADEKKVSGFGFQGLGFEFRVWVSGFGFGFRVLGFEFRVSSFEFWILESKVQSSKRKNL